MNGIAAHRVFFAAAIIQSVASLAIWIFVHPVAMTALGHAHELIFGYALAIVAGFLLTKTAPSTNFLILTLWIAARLAFFLTGDFAILRAILTIIATCVIVTIAARGFLRAIKRGQNSVFPVPLVLLALCEVASQLPAFGVTPQIERPAILTALFAVVGLILVMGGRIIGAALSGAVQRAGGERLPPRPDLERVIGAALVGVALSSAFNAPLLILGLCALTAGGAILWRLAVWRAGLRHASIELLALILAELFIAGGFIGTGLLWLGPPWPGSAPLHLITVGGIGMTTMIMMLKTTAQRERRKSPERNFALAGLLMSLAAIVRAGLYSSPNLAYPLAALAWIGTMAASLRWIIGNR